MGAGVCGEVGGSGEVGGAPTKAKPFQTATADWDGAVGDDAPLHVHKNEDEWFYVLDGEVTFHVGGENHSGRTGAFVSLPRGIPHTITVESPSARFLVLNTPGGFERMFELAPKTVEEAVRALEAYDMEVVGPHPRQAAVKAG